MKAVEEFPELAAELESDVAASEAQLARSAPQSIARAGEPLYLQPAAACARWGIGKTSLYKAINGKLPGCERLPKIVVVKFGASTLIHVPSGDAFFSQLPRYGDDVSS